MNINIPGSKILNIIEKLPTKIPNIFVFFSTFYESLDFLLFFLMRFYMFPYLRFFTWAPNFDMLHRVLKHCPKSWHVARWPNGLEGPMCQVLANFGEIQYLLKFGASGSSWFEFTFFSSIMIFWNFRLPPIFSNLPFFKILWKSCYPRAWANPHSIM